MTTTCRHPRLARALSAAVAGATAAALTVVLSGVATADPLADARARAAALAKTVAVLQTQAEVAIERYDAVETQLGQAVTERILAQRDADGAVSQTATDQAQADDRVRALYESGGAAALWASVLDGSNLSDAMTRYHDVGVILGLDRSTIASAQTRADTATSVAARLSGLATTVTRLQVAAASAATRVTSLLAAQQQALASADQQVRALLAQAEAAAAAAGAASFAAAVQAAGGTVNGPTNPPNATVAAAIAAARTKLGDPYQWGGTGPDAYDCSGLTQFAYGSAGVALPRVAADQYNVGTHVDLGHLLPGDLLFWATDPNDAASIHHVAIYLGDGLMIAAPHTGDVVKVEPVYMDGFFGATRPWANG